VYVEHVLGQRDNSVREPEAERDADQLAPRARMTMRSGARSSPEVRGLEQID
jgi:hypothetical protein